MPNIFSGLNKMADDEIRLQIALFQSVNIGNAVKETSYKAVGKFVDFAKMIVGKDSSDTVNTDNQYNGVEDIVSEKIKSLQDISRSELDELLRSIIIEKCNILNTDSAVRESSDELLSIIIIRESAKVYSLNANLPPAALADDISRKYYEQFLNRLHKNLQKETLEEAKITDLKLQKRLNEISIESKRDMSRKIILKEFSGRGIGNVIRTETGIRNITVVAEFLGLEAFDILRTVIQSVYDAVLGINRLSRAMVTQLLWASVTAYGTKFAISQDVLPSFVAGNMRTEQNEEEKVYLTLLSNRKESEKNIEICSLDVQKIKDELSDLQIKSEKENAEFNEIKGIFEALEAKKYLFENNSRKTKDEIKSYFAEVVSAKKRYDRAELSLKKRMMQSNTLEVHLSQKEQELRGYKREYMGINENAKMMIEQKSTQLELVWQAFFYKFKFASDVYEQVVTEFTKAETLKIEEYLKEMHDSDDRNAFGTAMTELSDKEHESLAAVDTESADSESAESESTESESAESESTESESADSESAESESTYCGPVSCEIVKCAVCMVANGKNAEIIYANNYIKKIRKQKNEL